MRYINVSHVKSEALRVSKELRAGKFTRVGHSFLERLDRRVCAMVSMEVLRHPSVGKTLK